MRFLRNHWYDLAPALALATGLYILKVRPGMIELLLWLNLIALLLHQFEEYRIPGHFPEMINRVLFSSRRPDRFPLNTNTSLIVNTGGWLIYFLSALLADRALWLGLAAITVSLGNVVAHGFVFNIKGNTLYNPGMLSFILLLLPVSFSFIYIAVRDNAASPSDWAAGAAIGISLSAGLFRFIKLMKDEETVHVFRA